MLGSSRKNFLAPLGYKRTRLLLSAAGMALLLVLVLIMALRGVDRIEIIAALLYVPVFVSFMVWGLVGGLVAGIAAAVVYVAMRSGAADIIGMERFIGLVAFRAAAYVAFGAIGGWASSQLESPLRKLEQHDMIDDATGLQNARFFLRETDLEKARADRYGTAFSVVALEIGGSGSTRAPDMRAIAATLDKRIRTVDRAVHADDGNTHLFAVILPETPAAGAEVVTDNLAAAVEQVAARDAGAVQRQRLTYPEDAERLHDLRERFLRVERMEHPEDDLPAGSDTRAT